eukprot:g10074.t2
MGKKGKGTKKEDKPKKEKDVPQTTAAKSKAIQEALEGVNVTVSTPTARPPPPPRTSASKKSDRGGSAPTKIGCTESFRWDNSEKAPVLTPMEKPRRKVSRFFGPDPFFIQAFHGLHSWHHYLKWRCNGDKAWLESALKSKTLKDGLSGPLMIAHMTIQWMVYNPALTMLNSLVLSSLVAMETGEPLHIVVVGATAVYEEPVHTHKVLRESDYWDELLAIFCRRKVRLYLTGPEMSGMDGEFKRRPGLEEGQQQQEENEPRVECWKTSAVDFFLKKGRLELFQKEDTVVVSLNPGFGVAARRMLNTPVAKQDQATNQVLWNWIPTLHFIAALELPLMVTGIGEKAEAVFTKMILEQAVGMYSVTDLSNSPLSFESTVPGQEDEVRGNAFFMIVQGQQPGFRFATESTQVPLGDKDPRYEALRKIASRPPGTLTTERWKRPSSGAERLQHKGIRERASPLVPLKRYGSYPPDKRETCNPDEDGQSERDVPVQAGREEKEGLLPPAVVELKHSVVDEGPGSLKIILETPKQDSTHMLERGTEE